MAMALALALAFLTIAFVSSLLIYYVSLFRPYLPSCIRRSTSSFSYVMTLFVIRLEWAIDFLFCYCLFPNYKYVYVVQNYMPEEASGDHGGGYDDRKTASAADVGECSVCLFEVEEGEEIGDLRCGHVFHRFCIETWVRYGRFKCPLCRGSLAPPPLNLDSDQVVEHEVRLRVEFKTCIFHERNRWWLP